MGIGSLRAVVHPVDLVMGVIRVVGIATFAPLTSLRPHVAPGIIIIWSFGPDMKLRGASYHWYGNPSENPQ